MCTTIPPIRKRTYGASIRHSSDEIVRELRDLLRAKLVAYIAGVTETRAVREWADAVRNPNSGTLAVLRHAHRVAFLIAQSEGDEVVPVWFQGMNPYLGDRSPARMLREGDFEQEAPRVRAAADVLIGI